MKALNPSAWAVAHPGAVLFCLIGTLLLGVLAYLRLGRMEDPSFGVPLMSAVVAWPGATAQEVQDQVLDGMERELRNIEGIDHVSSFARQGYGGLYFWMQGGTPKAELERAWYAARKKIADARQRWPDDVRGPTIDDELSDVYGVLYAYSAPELSWPELQRVVEDAQRELQAMPGIGKVRLFGQQAERVYVEVSTTRLAALGIGPHVLADALARQNRLTPAGSTEGRGDRVHVRMAGAPRDARDVADLPVQSGGRLLKLADIAHVYGGLEDPPSYTVRHDGRPVLLLGVAFERGGDIIALGRALDARMAALQAALPAGVAVDKVADQPRVVSASVWEFQKSFLEALAIVLAVCFVALGWRSGVVVAASVPLVLAVVAVVMLAMGWTLDRVSLGALIIALGLLVDDAIIAVETMVVKIEHGWDRARAATFAYTSTAFPMLTGTLVTVAGFMPVGFARSISGEYAGGVFWVTGVALVASWLVAVFYTPYLGAVLLRPPVRPDGGPTPAQGSGRLRRIAGVRLLRRFGSERLLERIGSVRPLRRVGSERLRRLAGDRLRRIVRWCVGHRVAVLATTAVALAAAVAGLTVVQHQFFPTASRLELIVDLRLREGASFTATQEQVRRLEHLLSRDPQVTSHTAYTGGSAPRFFLSLIPELPNPGFAQVIVQTASPRDREAVRARLLELFRADEAFPDLRGRVTRFEFGPPVGYPVQFRILGPDPARVREIAHRVRDIVRRSPLVRDTHLDWNEQARALRAHLDQHKARLLGISSDEVSLAMQMAMTGMPVTQLRRGERLVDVVLRAVPEERDSLERLGDVNLFTRAGSVVPLSQLATLEPAVEEPVLWRRNGETVLTVRSDLADGVQGPAATSAIWPSLQPVLDDLPAGYRLERGGAVEESEKSNRALFAVFPAMVVVMAVLLLLQLQSFSRIAMVLMTAPLGLIGAVPALLLVDAPFGFVALLGVIALGGMIMRNAVIVVDQIDRDIATGMRPADAVVEATLRRCRPVVLTAAAAVLAMVPLASSVFWGPMAIAIMGGLVAGTVLTLAVVPALYAAFEPATSARRSGAAGVRTALAVMRGPRPSNTGIGPGARACAPDPLADERATSRGRPVR